MGAAPACMNSARHKLLPSLTHAWFAALAGDRLLQQMTSDATGRPERDRDHPRLLVQLQLRAGASTLGLQDKEPARVRTSSQDTGGRVGRQLHHGGQNKR